MDAAGRRLVANLREAGLQMVSTMEKARPKKRGGAATFAPYKEPDKRFTLDGIAANSALDTEGWLGNIHNSWLQTRHIKGEAIDHCAESIESSRFCGFRTLLTHCVGRFRRSEWIIDVHCETYNMGGVLKRDCGGYISKPK
jgi:hypothetical protein